MFLSNPDSVVFYIIWNPLSDLPPTMKFDTRSKAQTVARDMAARHGQPFYVMRAVSLSERTTPVKTTSIGIKGAK